MQVRGTLKKAQRVSIPSGGFSLRGMVRNGTCLKCETCGETTGCS
jgi:hypothetical protein